MADVARFFFAGIDGLLLHRLTRQEDDEADRRALDDLVEATTALAEGRLVSSGAGTADLVTL